MINLTTTGLVAGSMQDMAAGIKAFRESTTSISWMRSEKLLMKIHGGSGSAVVLVLIFDDFGFIFSDLHTIFLGCDGIERGSSAIG